MSSSRKLGKEGTANAVTGCKEDDIYAKDVKMSIDDNIDLVTMYIHLIEFLWITFIRNVL